MGTEAGTSSGLVDNRSQQYKRKRELGPRGSSYTTMAQFFKSDVEGYNVLAEEIEKVGRPFFDYFNGKTINNTGRYISDVFLFRGRRERDRTLEILCQYGGSRRNGMFAYSVESDHIHIIHDCTYSGRNCRCTFKEKIEPFGNFGPDRKYNKPLHEFTRTDWYDVFVYFFLAKRGARNIWFRGKNWEVPSDAKLVRWEEVYNTRRQMVRIEDSGSDSECERQADKRPRRSVDSTSDYAVHGKKPSFKGKYAYIKLQTKALLVKYYCSPVSAIRDVKEFRDDVMLSDPKNKEYLQAAFDDFGKDIMDMSLREIYEMLKDGNPKFFLSMNYGNREESMEIIDSFIRFQCGDDDEQVCVFLNAVVDILDKRIPKCNCLVIHSPPSSGKNFFFDMVFAICMNYGQLGMANKNNLFAFQEAPNKRLLVWNEPNYEAAVTDTLKMMFAGDPYTVRVKHAMDTHVRHTPVIVLTNNPVAFMHDTAFKDRIIKFRWEPAPFLKDVEFKPYPLTFFDLLIKYNINF